MLWKELKEEVEKQGVVDNDEVVLPMVVSKNVICEYCGQEIYALGSWISESPKTIRTVRVSRIFPITRLLRGGL